MNGKSSIEVVKKELLDISAHDPGGEWDDDHFSLYELLPNGGLAREFIQYKL